MDDLGAIVGGLTGSAGGAGGADVSSLLDGLTGGAGGLEGLVARLQAGGLADQVGSWIGTGPNQPVSPDQIQHALGDQQIQALSSQTGLSIGQLLPMLAALLPTIIDKLTPDGKLPSGGAGAGIDVGGLLNGLAGATGGSGGAGGAGGGLEDVLGGLTKGS